MTHLTRRKFLYLSGLSAGALVAVGCSPSPAATPAPAATSTVAPTAVPPPPTVAPTAAISAPTIISSAPPTAIPAAPTAAPPPPTATPAASKALAADLAQASVRFLDTLDGNQRKKASYAFEHQERFRWHWTTPSGFPRNGLALREMNAGQKAAALALLKTGVSEAGYQKALDIITLQKDLGNDTEQYYATIFGTPGGAAPWGWRFEGHHLSRQFTIADGQVWMTPLFHGSWPTSSSAGLRAMPREEDAALELINALQGKNRQTAIFQASTLFNHVTQNNPKVSPLAPVGIAYPDLDDHQQKLVLELLQSYLGAMPAFIADAGMQRIQQAGLDKVRFGWTGALEKRRPQYYRLQGTTFLLEFDNSRNGGTHVHSVWRDFEQDFGYHVL